MYISLYRRYRPQTFSDMVGQSAAVSVLMESLKEGSIGHAYLFSGPRGCGKTSAARLVAKSLDCLDRRDCCEPCGVCENCRAIAAGEHLDVIEIDGASNRGIGEIRDLKSHVNLKALSAAYKVYIIDEVHMLTEAAFNALLKTLEEPPANVIFLLATTEPHKVPVTIRSRCQHIPFHRISIADTVGRLRYVCGEENIEAEDEAVWEIARQADGALRDALSLTEQAVALGRGRLSLESVRELTGGSSRTELEKWVALLRTDGLAAAEAIHSMMSRGVSPERFCESLFSLFRDLWFYSMWGDKSLDAMETSAAEKAFLAAESERWETGDLKEACMLCSRLLPRARYGMKNDVFSGMIFMELQNIIGGARSVPRSCQPKEQGVVVPENYDTVGPSLQIDSHPEPRPEKAICAAAEHVELPEFAGDLFTAAGGGDFEKLLSFISEDRLPIAAALLDAELSIRGGKFTISFERDMPAKTFLAAAQNRKAVIEAASKLWELGDADELGPVNQNSDMSVQYLDSPVPKDTGGVRGTGEIKHKKADTPIEYAMNASKATLLYVKSAASNEEDAEGNE